MRETGEFAKGFPLIAAGFFVTKWSDESPRHLLRVALPQNLPIRSRDISVPPASIPVSA
jgi:hypothetical protein